MADRLAVDPDEVLRLAREYTALADEAIASLRQLEVGLDAQGAPWGEDTLGRTFAESYLPALHQLLDGLHTVVQRVHMYGENLTGFAESLAVEDSTIEASIRAIADSIGGASPSAGQVANSLAAQSVSSASATASSARAPQAARGQTPQFPSATQQPQSPTPQSQSQDRIPQSLQLQSPQQRASVTAGHDRSGARTTAAASAPAGTGPIASSPTAPRASGPVSPQQRPGVSTGEEDPPPRGSNNKRPLARRPASSRPKPDKNRPELTRSVIERHGIELSGIDNPEVDDDVLAEFAAALDDVLPIYPAIDLRGVAICELPREEVSTAMWNWTPGPDGPCPYTAWIVLATAAARDPQHLAYRVRRAVESNELVSGSEQRPVYSTIVRELGRALDVAGGFRARRRVQRVLLAEFLPTVGEQDGLRVVLDSYREWRGGLRGYGFYGRRLHPATALAEAFTDVHLHGGAASAPARVLHHLLVETATPR